MEIWTITATANAIMTVIYSGIAWIMIKGVADGKQWRTNPLATATAAIFITCTIGHGIHLAHTIPPFSTLDPVAAVAARAAFGDPRLLVWDVFTAGTAIAYWLLRSRLTIVYQGASLCEDLREREIQAHLIHEGVMTGISKARGQMEIGDREGALLTLERTLDESKNVITTLLGTRGKKTELGPGDLRREGASG